MNIKVILLGLAWLAGATVLGASGLVAQLHPPWPQLILIGLTCALLLASRKSPDLRRWLSQLPPQAYVWLHLSRAVAGGAFLIYYSRGDLPRAFALPGGWGDIAVAVSAVFVLCVTTASTLGRRAYWVWNTFGVLDILLVVLNAARLALADPGSMQQLLRLPLSLLPTFLVPLVIASHVLLFIRLRQLAAASRA